MINCQEFDQLVIKSEGIAGIGTQIPQLISRAYKGISRNPKAMRARIMTTVVMALMLLCIFWQINGLDASSRYNVAGASFFMGVNLLMNSLMGTVLIF